MKVSLESLESRRLLTAATNAIVGFTVADKKLVPATSDITVHLVPAVSAHLSHTGTLMITGTTGNDTIQVFATATITTNTNDSHTVEQTISVSNIAGATFNRADVKRIVVDSGAGNDEVSISPQLTLKCTLIGGKGNDTLVGGGGADTISGGAGNDELFAASTEFVNSDGATSMSGLPPDIAITVGVIAPRPSSGIPSVTTTVYEGGKTADSLEGGAGNDTIYAGNGSDRLNGGDGKDSVIIIGRGSAVPPPIFFRRGDDARSFDGLTLFSIEAVTPQ